MIARSRVLAPFQFRNYRFQFPSDLAASWALEMEQVALGWYVLSETGSVTLLTLYVALQVIGVLLAPLFGALGDRIGHRNVLLVMRAFYAALAATNMAMALTGTPRPAYVLMAAAMLGLVRSSDIVMRNALVSITMPPAILMAAVGTQRTTMDSARIAGALSGAALVATLGIGTAYIAITAAYALSTVLIAGMTPAPSTAPKVVAGSSRFSPVDDLRQAFRYIRETPYMIATLLYALLVNLTLFPLLGGLLAYVAKEIYRVDQTGLGYLVASYSAGSLLGSIAIGQIGAHFRPARMMLIGGAIWHVAMLAFAQIDVLAFGVVTLFVVGLLQSSTMLPMSVVLMRNSDSQFRGRILGVRSLVVYTLPLSVMAAGPLIEWFGYVATASAYCLFGVAATIAIAFAWREHIWRRDAEANAR